MKILILFMALSCISTVRAQTNYTLLGVMENNGTHIEDNRSLSLGDSCTFSVADENGKEIILDVYKWSFEIEGRMVNYISDLSGDLPNYGIKIDSLLYNDYIVCRTFKRYTLENDSSVYYRGKVVFEGESYGHKVKLNKEFYINLLPSSPKVKLLDITWSHYDEESKIYDDGYMTLQINSFDARIIEIREGYGNDFPNLSSYFDPNVDADKGIGTIGFYDEYAFLVFIAHNGNGWVESKDTLRISRAVTSISDIKVDDIPFYPNPVKDMLSIKPGNDTVFPLSIYDAQGKLIKYIGMPASFIDVSYLVPGMYLILYRDKKTNKNRTFKMIKNL